MNVALPSIQSDLHFSASGLAWVVSAYLIAFGGLLLLSGRIGDLVGSKRVFFGGLITFTLASLLCDLAWSQQLLVAERFLQAMSDATGANAGVAFGVAAICMVVAGIVAATVLQPEALRGGLERGEAVRG